MPFNFCDKTSFTQMCRREYFGIHSQLQKCRPHSQLFNDRHPQKISVQSYQQQQCQQCTLVLSWTKNFTANEILMLWVIQIGPTVYMVSWLQNWNWKSTFIKHAQLMTLEGCVSVQLSAFAITHTVAYSSVCESLRVHTSLVIHYP